jgi:hypothetical protein
VNYDVCWCRPSPLLRLRHNPTSNHGDKGMWIFVGTMVDLEIHLPPKSCMKSRHLYSSHDEHPIC